MPYILQCCSTLLSNRCRLGNVERLGNAERELLYTLHWILLEAPRICCVVDTESLLYPQTIIEQFVHGLIPHVYSMRESDLTFRLENGVAIWGPLWKHEKPQVTPFIAEVIIKDTESEEATQNHLDVESDFSAATFFDVAILKCLSSTNWAEEGVVWALCYLAEYLKREFNLPDVAVTRGHSAEIRLCSSAGGSPAQGNRKEFSATKTATDSSMANLHVDKQSTEPDGDPLKTVGGDLKNMASEDAKEVSSLSVCLCQTGDDKNTDVTKGEETGVCDNLDTTVPEGVTNSKDKDVKEHEDVTHKLSSDGPQASGLERSGSIRLRIRVQSSPVLSKGGRVITAVASPSGSSLQQEVKMSNQEDTCISPSLGDTRTFQNPKVFIKPSNSLHVPFLGVANNGGVQDGDLTGSQKGDVPHLRGSGIFHSEAKPESTDSLSGKSANATRGNKEADTGPVQILLRDPSSSSSAFAGMISSECEEAPNTGRNNSEGATAVDPVTEVLLSKHLSGRPNSSEASSSSAESESQPLLNPANTVQTKPTSILESLDTPRNSISINRDSFMKIHRFFVLPGTADYITTDGRLSILMILQALHSILRENPSSRICDAALTVLSHVVKIHENNESKKRESSFEYDDRTVAETQAVGFRSPHSENVLGRLRASFYGRPPTFLSLAVGCLVCLIKALGCPLGTVLSTVAFHQYIRPHLFKRRITLSTG